MDGFAIGYSAEQALEDLDGDSEASDAEEDNVEEQVEVNDEIHTDELGLEEEDSDNEEDYDFFLSRDKLIEWSSKEPTVRRRAAHNIVRFTPGIPVKFAISTYLLSSTVFIRSSSQCDGIQPYELFDAIHH
jgi:hypothetical protein